MSLAEVLGGLEVMGLGLTDKNHKNVCKMMNFTDVLHYE